MPSGGSVSLIVERHPDGNYREGSRKVDAVSDEIWSQLHR